MERRAAPMKFTSVGSRWGIIILLAFAGLVPNICCAQDFKTFTSEDYGFVMKYPGTWVKAEPGNYYLVFQSPELIDGIRGRIHVSAHKPVKDNVSVFIQELRNGLADIQKKGGKEQVRILDEGDFKSEVPGSYFFFIQAYEPKDKVWMDIVIVFYKHDQTLVRISCLAPSSAMEKMQGIYNEVLTSVKFVDQAAPAPAPAPAPRQPAPGVMQQPAAPPMPAPSVRPAPSPAQTMPSVRPAQPSAPAPAPAEPEAEADEEVAPAPPPRQVQPAPAPRPGPRGPSRESDKPATGIVQ